MPKTFAHGSITVDATSLTAPAFVGDESGGEFRLRKSPRQILWSEVSGLRLTRDHRGEVFYAFDVPERPPFRAGLVIGRFHLDDPEAFQEAVEQCSGRHFEKTFRELSTETALAEPSGMAAAGSQAGLAQIGLAELQQSPGARSFLVITPSAGMLGSVGGLAIGLLVIGLLWRFAPLAVSKLATSRWGFVAIVTSGWFAGHFLLPRLGRRSQLVAAPNGLYAQVPKRGFPSFTPWEEVRDFVYTREPKVTRSFRLSANRSDSRHRFSLWTARASYSFVCEEIESAEEFMESIQEHLRKD